VEAEEMAGGSLFLGRISAPGRMELNPGQKCVSHRLVLESETEEFLFDSSDSVKRWSLRHYQRTDGP
jgi:hypothetical protein